MSTRDDFETKLTSIVMATLDHFKKDIPNLDCVISFAKPKPPTQYAARVTFQVKLGRTPLGLWSFIATERTIARSSDARAGFIGNMNLAYKNYRMKVISVASPRRKSHA